MKIIITESQYKLLLENIPIIDNIIDRISKIGFDNLTNKEKYILNKYSEWLRSGKKGSFEINVSNDVEYDDMDDKLSKALLTSLSHNPKEFDGKLRDGSPLVYTTNELPRNFDDFIEHTSSITWDDNIWSGYIEVDYIGNILNMEYGILDDDDNYYPLKDEMSDTQWNELKIWIQEVVVPNL